MTSVQWIQDRNGMGNTPVMMIREQLVGSVSDSDPDLIYGRIFAGSHGRGIFKTTSLATIGVRSHASDQAINDQEKNKLSLKIYPNPATEFTQIDLDLTQTSDVEIVLRDMTGRVVKRSIFKALDSDTKNVRVDLSGIRAGTYIVEQNVGSFTKTGKLIVR